MAQPHYLRDFFEAYPVVEFQEGERVIQARELSSNIFFISQGFVKIYSISKLGKELVVAYLNATKRQDVIIGLELGLGPKKFYIEALSQTQVRKAPRTGFIDFLNRNPLAVQEVVGSLYRHLRGLYEQVESLKAGDARTRIASCLYFLAREFGEETNQASRIIPLHVTHDMVARCCGITRETATTQLTWLRWHGVIAMEGKLIRVPNLEVLRDLTEIEDGLDLTELVCFNAKDCPYVCPLFCTHEKCQGYKGVAKPT